MDEFWERKGVVISNKHKTTVNDHSIFAYTSVEEATQRRVYTMLVSLNIDSLAVMVTYKPPSESAAVGDMVWQHMINSLQ